MFFFFFFNDTATTEIYTLSLHDALPISRNISAAGPCAGKGTPPETLDCLSHDTGRWTLHLLQRSRSERRADAFSAARTSVFLTDVRSFFRPAFRSLPPYRAGLPRLRTQ